MAELAAVGLAAASSAASSAPAWLPWASAAATAGTAGLSYAQAQGQAKTAKTMGDYNARELERAAAEERAAGTRKAQEQRLKNELILSRQRAVGARSGAGTSEGESFVDLVSDTAERGRYLSDLDISMGENSATGLEQKAAMARARGSAEASAARGRGTAALVDGATGLIKTGLSRMPAPGTGSAGLTYGGSNSSDEDLIDFDATDGGWSREIYRTRRRR